MMSLKPRLKQAAAAALLLSRGLVAATGLAQPRDGFGIDSRADGSGG
jgi:hypothetical protein